MGIRIANIMIVSCYLLIIITNLLLVLFVRTNRKMLLVIDNFEKLKDSIVCAYNLFCFTQRCC